MVINLLRYLGVDQYYWPPNDYAVMGDFSHLAEISSMVIPCKGPFDQLPFK